jgi:hypothetical protein
MSDSISDLSTSTSQRFRPGAERRLAGSVVAPARLTVEDRERMYEVLETYFSGTDRARFEADLREKEGVILLRDAEHDRIQGFSTFMRMNARIDDRDVVAFFSGDTIIEREFWGDTLLSRMWARLVFAEADRLAAASPATRVYWFLISSGYKTWRFMPVFFRQFFPNLETETPLDLQQIMDTLGTRKFGDEYRPEEGIVRFRNPMPLRPGVADLTEEKLRDPQVAFFAARNPGWPNGDELVCLTEIARANLTRAGQRMVQP